MTTDNPMTEAQFKVLLYVSRKPNGTATVFSTPSGTLQGDSYAGIRGSTYEVCARRGWLALTLSTVAGFGGRCSGTARLTPEGRKALEDSPWRYRLVVKDRLAPAHSASVPARKIHFSRAELSALQDLLGYAADEAKKEAQA